MSQRVLILVGGIILLVVAAFVAGELGSFDAADVDDGFSEPDRTDRDTEVKDKPARRGQHSPSGEPLEIVGVEPPAPGVPSFGTDAFGRPGSIVEGRVRLRSGEPIACPIRLFEDTSLVRGAPTLGALIAKTDTDDAGEFIIEELPATSRYVIRADPEMHPPIHAEVVVDPGSREQVELVIESGHDMRGVVRDERGDPVVGATVRSFQTTGLATMPYLGYEKETTSDENGEFVLRGVGAGLRSFICSAEGRATHSVPRHRVDRLAATRLLEFVLTPGKSISGSVLDENGRGIGGARLTIRPVAGRLGSSSLSEPRPVGPDGRFEVQGLGDGIYVLSAEHDGYVSFSPTTAQDRRRGRVNAKAGDLDVRVTLIRTRVLNGIVVDEDGAVLTAFRLDLTNGMNSPLVGPGRGRLNVDEQGRFGLALPARSRTARAITIHVRAPGFAGGRVAIDLVEAGPGDLHGILIRMRKGASIEGLVFDHEGSPIGDALVRATLSPVVEGSDDSVRFMGQRDRVSARTNADGRYVLDGLLDGSWRIDVRDGVHAPQRLDDPVKILGAGREVAPDIRMVQGAIVQGTVRRSSGGAVEDCRLELRGRDRLPSYRFRTGITGEFRFDNVIAGEYELHVVTVRGLVYRGRAAVTRIRATAGNQLDQILTLD